MGEEQLRELLAAGREGGSSPSGRFRTRVLPGPMRNRIELQRGPDALPVFLEGRWLHTVSTAFSAHERWVAAAGFMGGVGVWEAETGASVAFFADIEADPGGDGRLPVLFARDDALLVCGGRALTFIETAGWTRVRRLEQPSAAVHSSGDPVRIAAFEPADGRLIRWTLNVKSFEIEGADRVRDTRVYRGLFGLDRRAC